MLRTGVSRVAPSVGGMAGDTPHFRVSSSRSSVARMDPLSSRRYQVPNNFPIPIPRQDPKQGSSYRPWAALSAARELLIAPSAECPCFQSPGALPMAPSQSNHWSSLHQDRVIDQSIASLGPAAAISLSPPGPRHPTHLTIPSSTVFLLTTHAVLLLQHPPISPRRRPILSRSPSPVNTSIIRPP